MVKGSDTTKLGYKLENIELEYEVIRSKTLAEETVSTYNSGKEFAYDLVMRERVVPITRGSENPPHHSGEPPAQVAQGPPASVHQPLQSRGKGL